MTVQADAVRGDTFYNGFYETGGWKYSFLREFRWHRRHVVKRFGLGRGMRMLEVACGAGFHTDLFRRMGFDCIGVDRSEAGIAWARTHHPKSHYLHADIMDDLPLEFGSFDIVLARGCSAYHYDLAGEQARSVTARVLRFLKPGGVFVMTIATDLSGRRDPDRIWQNTLDDYRAHFSAFDREFSVDWYNGMALCGLYNRPAKSPADDGMPLELATA